MTITNASRLPVTPHFDNPLRLLLGSHGKMQRVRQEGLMNREITDPSFMHDALREADAVSLVFNTGEFPYVLQFNFVLYGDSIFIHGAPESRKLELIERDSRAGLCAAVDIRVEKTTTRYRSVCGIGLATLVEDDTLKIEALKALAAKYNIESITGKHSRSTEEKG